MVDGFPQSPALECPFARGPVHAGLVPAGLQPSELGGYSGIAKAFNSRIPFLKFFIKKELLYVPLLGIAWWALDYPFMRRRGGASARKDLQAARKACEKFRHMPTSVISLLKARVSPQKSTVRSSRPIFICCSPRLEASPWRLKPWVTCLPACSM